MIKIIILLSNYEFTVWVEKPTHISIRTSIGLTMENYHGIREIECVPKESKEVEIKIKRKPTVLGFTAFALTLLTFAAYATLAIRYYLFL